jgi:hypothetical protein
VTKIPNTTKNAKPPVHQLSFLIGGTTTFIKPFLVGISPKIRGLKISAMISDEHPYFKWSHPVP